MKLTPQAKQALTHIVGIQNVLEDELSLALYAYDCSMSRTRPDAVVLVQTTQPEQSHDSCVSEGANFSILSVISNLFKNFLQYFLCNIKF